MTHSRIGLFWLLAFLPALGITNALARDLQEPAKLDTQLAPYPIASEVYTTRQRTVVMEPPAPFETVLPSDIQKYEPNGYGRWHYGPGSNAGMRADLMPTTFTTTTLIHRAQLLNFFAFTDVHLTDEETPAQRIGLSYLGSMDGSYTPTMLLTTQIFDAAVQTINALHKQKPFDFGMGLGDACNDTQYNELRWYLDILDGQNITPDSGVKDDPIPGPYNDYQDDYKAAGLDPSISWYQVLGNHDHIWAGLLPPNDYVKQTAIGVNIVNLGDQFDPLGLDSRGMYMGAVDGSTTYGTVIGAGLAANIATTPTVTSADVNRRLLSRKDWMLEFFDTTSNPMGHGFSQSNLTTGFACYSFEPKAGLPIKIIVLDDTQREDDTSPSLGMAHSSLDMERYNWLVSQLDQGQAEGKLMVIAAHCPIGVCPKGHTFGWNLNAPITEPQLIAKLHTYPNLLCWISGHFHRNAVTVFKSPDAAHPELGFWEIETASLRDFPKQFRTFEILRNNDDTVSILATDVDPAVGEGSLAALSRSYAVAEYQLTNATPSFAYNAELIKQLTPAMAAKIKNYGTPIQSACRTSAYLYQ